MAQPVGAIHRPCVSSAPARWRPRPHQGDGLAHQPTRAREFAAATGFWGCKSVCAVMRCDAMLCRSVLMAVTVCCETLRCAAASVPPGRGFGSCHKYTDAVADAAVAAVGRMRCFVDGRLGCNARLICVPTPSAQPSKTRSVSGPQIRLSYLGGFTLMIRSAAVPSGSPDSER